MSERDDAWGSLLRQLGRRGFLQGLAAFVVGCSGGDEAAPAAQGGGAGQAGAAGQGGGGQGGAGQGGSGGAPPEPTLSPWEALREMRDAVRKSPDHLVYEAERAVATKDPAVLFAFVRDRFATLPAANDGLGSSTRLRWGVRGTLRSGAGTLRDKCELLVDLYTRAGFTAQVMRGSPEVGEGFVKRVLVRTIERPFAPVVEPARLARWRKVLNVPESGKADVIDESGAEAKALADALLALLPAEAKAEPFSFETPATIPLVGVEVGGKQMFANLAEPTGTFGPSGTKNTPLKASAADPLPKISVALSVVTTASPETPVELARAEYATEDLVGRSLRVAFVPPEDLPVLVKRRLGDVRTFLATLALRAPGMSPEDEATFTRVGSAVTLSGEVVTFEGDGSLRVQGQPVDASPVDPAKLASVAKLEVTASASRFPEVRLRVAALDASGQSVQGLPIGAFRVVEGDAPQVASLSENRSPPPRVLFVLDTSSSLPKAFLGEAAATLISSLAEKIKASSPGCAFRVHAVGGNPKQGAWTEDPAVLHEAALSQKGIGSELWEALAEGAGLGATVIVMITDGKATDAASPEVLGPIGMAPPSVYLGVGDYDMTTLEAFAKLTGGESLPVASETEASDAIFAFIQARRRSSYHLRYIAPEQGPDQRQVGLSLAEGAVKAEAAYTVPPADARPGPVRIGGVLLTFEVQGQKPITRVLAGHARLLPGAPPVYDEVEASFFGATEVRFEGSPPTLSATLDDLLTMALGYEPLEKALASGDEKAIVEAILAAPPPLLPGALALHGPLPSPADVPLFATGLRAVISSVAMRTRTTVRRHVDVTPLGPHAAMAPDPRVAFEATLRATARMARVERALFTTSTAERLEGKPLVYVAPHASWPEGWTDATPDTLAAWSRAAQGLTDGHRLVPQAPAPLAFWHIDRRTGALLGILDDGSGGGQSLEQYEKEMNAVLELYSRLASLASALGTLGTAGGVWLSLEITKAKKLLGALVVIAGGTPSSDPTNWDDFFGTVPCAGASAAFGAGASALASSGSAVGKILGGFLGGIAEYDPIVGALTGKSLICNP